MPQSESRKLSVFRTAGIGLLGIALALPLSAAEETGKTFAAPGATLYYEVRGGGPGTPLFLANGGPGYEIHKAIPGSRFVVFERSGHLPFFEEPEAFRRALEEFLAGQ